ncbi:ferritin-like domain-containing protein [Parasediminibacterium sp. JCM 36343]|uniref:ferritin-like domain-containing protein n=1 Tax=Parasediminibacterium sp. JCM 36343 TaxID=3374279 RepID=UPI00397D4634
MEKEQTTASKYKNDVVVLAHERQATTNKEHEKGMPAFSSSRRNFLALAGSATLGSAFLLNACKKSDDNTPATYASVTLTADDYGILNYAYALEQLEAAFYTQVIATPYTSISASELSLLTDIKNHEVAHREFFKSALGAKAIGGLSVNFTSINFKDRASVLGAAMAFEDLGVGAYNGVAHGIANAAYLTLAGKIVSVEARHAAYIRELITPGSFAGSDVIDASTGIDRAITPTNVLKSASVYIYNSIDVSKLPL